MSFRERKKGFIFALLCGTVHCFRARASQIKDLKYSFGGMAEWSNALVLKTSEGHTSGGSNPSSSATKTLHQKDEAFSFAKNSNLFEIRSKRKSPCVSKAF